MKPEPWIIEELEEERRRREEEESRRHRIELPLGAPSEGAAPADDGERRNAPARVCVLDISPAMGGDDGNVVPV